MKSSIGIIGCGWLGLPLAMELVRKGYTVNGSTTSKEKMELLRGKGIQPYLIRLSEDRVEGPLAEFLGGIEILIINVPPNLRSGNKEDFVRKMELLYGSISVSAVKKIVWVSSTSVYGDAEGEVTEETPPVAITESGKQLFASENIFRVDQNLQTTIVRLGGLIGPDRHPVTHLAGKINLPNGNFPVNLIHLNDAVAIIYKIVSQGLWGEIYNGVYPLHPPKRDYYRSEARKRGLPLPEFSPDIIKEGKTITSCKLNNVKIFDFMTSIIG
ncbi:SDR family oxidoreductase [Flavobacteriaceae bacterium F89]|uniref:SDR family oxidoreductase n=1 Tax=Cerina litoralis TaxID=2874477 RepID=A0AAE3ETU1_9FLAO|nr:SDR family oxidoreductase [Cerina litoralis]MCG2460853.1 SDR family oxidoreductase [Cerina litoralis]